MCQGAQVKQEMEFKCNTKIEQIMAELNEEMKIAANKGRFTKAELIKEVIEKLKIINEA